MANNLYLPLSFYVPIFFLFFCPPFKTGIRENHRKIRKIIYNKYYSPNLNVFLFDVKVEVGLEGQRHFEPLTVLLNHTIMGD